MKRRTQIVCIAVALAVLGLPAISCFAQSLPSGRRINVGTGSGKLDLTSMEPLALKSGDTLVLKAGTYAGANLANLHGITILPAGPVVFTGTVNLTKNNGLVLDGTVLPGIPYGFTFQGFDGYAFVPLDNNQNIIVKGVLFDHIGGVVEGGLHEKWMVYDGTPASTLFYNLTFDAVKLTGHTTFYSGTWEGTKTYRNVVDGISMVNVIVENDGTGSSEKVRGHSLYHLLMDHWRITGPTAVNNGDHGIVDFNGNGVIRNIYRDGGWGYVARIWNCSMEHQSDTYVYNVIDVNSDCYGTVDVRIDTADLALHAPVPIIGNNAYVYNVTSGNKKARTYVATVAIVGDFSDGEKSFDVEVKNCFAFNNQTSNANGGMITKAFFPSGHAHLTVANNVAVEGALPAGYLLDTQHYDPDPAGPLVGKGATIRETAVDIYGHPRGKSYDIGAVQHQLTTAATVAARGHQGMNAPATIESRSAAGGRIAKR